MVQAFLLLGTGKVSRYFVIYTKMLLALTIPDDFINLVVPNYFISCFLSINNLNKRNNIFNIVFVRVYDFHSAPQMIHSKDAFLDFQT